MIKIEQSNDGRYFIRTDAGNVARGTNGEAWFTTDRAKAEASLTYLTLDYAARKASAHWLKSTWGVE